MGGALVVDCAKNIARHEAYKIPHHGSANADDNEIWDQLLIKEPLTMLTPFCRAGVLLPTCDDAQRILAKSPRSYLTAPATRRRYSAQDYAVQKTIDEVALESYAIPNGFGHVRLRKKLNGNDWDVSHFETALPLEQFVGQHCRRKKAKR